MASCKNQVTFPWAGLWLAALRGFPLDQWITVGWTLLLANTPRCFHGVCWWCGWTLRTLRWFDWEGRSHENRGLWFLECLCICVWQSQCLACLGCGTLTHPAVSRSLDSLPLGVLGAGRKRILKGKTTAEFRCVIAFGTWYASFLVNVFQVSWMLTIIY